MMRISSEAQLMSAFRESDHAQVHLPAGLTFPLAVKDYMKWTEPSGHRVYLVFEETQSGLPLGIVFERTNGSAATPASMCQWCHSVRAGNAIGMLTTEAGPNRRIGLYLCSDLSCKENALAPPGVNDFTEGISGREKVERILRRMNDFTKRNLF